MPTTNYLFICIASLLLISCATKTNDKDILQQVLQSENPKIKRVIDSADHYEVQILVSTIERHKDSVYFKDYQFRVNDSAYFYPASTVKLPISLLALEKLAKDGRFDRNTVFYIDGDSVETTVAEQVNYIFAISDNEASNRLYEYLGKDYVNTTLRDKGVSPVRISHRLSVPDAYNLNTKAVIFHQNDSTLTQIESTVSSPVKRLDLESTLIGKGYMDSNDSLLLEPMDFSEKNYLPIRSLHAVMKRIIFPASFAPKEQFQLSESDREFVLNSMSAVPRELGFDETEYYDSYGKFYLFGDSKEKIPETIKIYNKVGYAYGFLTDCAYIHDLESGTEFIVTTNLLVNNDGIFNDGKYQYDEIGIPFLAALGRELLESIKNQK